MNKKEEIIKRERKIQQLQAEIFELNKEVNLELSEKDTLERRTVVINLINPNGLPDKVILRWDYGEGETCNRDYIKTADTYYTEKT